MNRTRCLNFAKNEWLLLLSASGLLFTSLYLQRWPSYSVSDVEILYILFVLFVITTGLEKHHVVREVARRLEHGRWVAVKLVVATFFASMLVTNDVALLAIVPLTLLLRTANKEWLIILEALAANAGSALSPFGNPQNLFIYWFYEIPFPVFVKTIVPFSLVFLLLLLGAALALGASPRPQISGEPKKLSLTAYFYGAALVVFALAILRVLPLSVGWGVLLFALFGDRGSLRVDYALLATFACFFGFTDNLRVLLSGVLFHPRHVFALSALLSQFISNVPAALLLADFTDHWRSLLWGVSVGGFGSLIGSLANLIAYRIYVRQAQHRALPFALKFHALSYLAFAVGVGLYLFFE